MAHDLIDSTEMYLRTVLELDEEGIPALRARIAERLDLSAPSVSEGVARLEKAGLLRLATDRTVSLTAAGRELAEHVMRKHRLAERLLVDVLGLEPEHAHEEACRWEHVMSDRVEEKLVAFLGHPTRSPYGNPIPGSGLVGEHLVPLAEVNGVVEVVQISELLQRDQDVIHRLDEAGVRAGAQVSVSVEADETVLCTPDSEVRLTGEQARLVYVAASG